jgi:hypothetical protein
MSYTTEDILKVKEALEDIEIHEDGSNLNMLFTKAELDAFISEFDCKEMVKDASDGWHPVYFNNTDGDYYYSLRGILENLGDIYDDLMWIEPEIIDATNKD